MIYRKLNQKTTPAKDKSETSSLVARWDVRWDGLDWIEESVEKGEAKKLRYGGYPMRYTAIAQTVIHLIYDNFSVVYGYPAEINDVEISSCHPNEWLVIDAWDLS